MTQTDTVKRILAQMDIVRAQTWIDDEARAYALGHLMNTIESVMGTSDAMRNNRFRSIEQEYIAEKTHTN